MKNSGCCEYCGSILDNLGFARRCYTPCCPNEIAPEEDMLRNRELDAAYEQWCDKMYESAVAGMKAEAAA